MLELTPPSLLRLRKRRQDNYPTQAFQAGDMGMYVSSKVAQPEEEYLRYEADELESHVASDLSSATEASVVPSQVIYDETAVSTAVRTRLRTLRRRKRELTAAYIQGLRVLFREALRAGRKRRKQWVVVKRLTVQRPVYKKVPYRKLVRFRVELPPIKRPRTFYRRDANGKPRPYAMLVWVRRSKSIERVVIRTRRVQVGVRLVTRTIRAKRLVEYTDWASVRLVYGEAKEQRQAAFARELNDVKEKIRLSEQALRDSICASHTLITYTNTGYIPVSGLDTANPYHDPYIAKAWSLLPPNNLASKYEYFSHSFAGIDAFGKPYSGRPWSLLVEVSCPQPFRTGLPLVRTVVSKENAYDCLSKLRLAYTGNRPPRACESYWRDGEGVVPDQLLIPEIHSFKEYKPVPAHLDRSAMLQAAGSVSALLKREDTSFRLVRSLLELKDTGETARPIVDFVAFLDDVYKGSVKLPPSMRLKGGLKAGWSGLRLLASVYLTARMAIQPTIADADVLINNTLKWAVDARRSLTSILDELEKSKTNILHYRVKRTPGAPSAQLEVKIEDDDIRPGQTGTMSLTQFITMEGHALAGVVYTDADHGYRDQSLPDFVDETPALTDDEMKLPVTYEGLESSLLEGYTDSVKYRWRVKPDGGLYRGAVKYSTEGIVMPTTVRLMWERPSGPPNTHPPLIGTISDQSRSAIHALPLTAEWQRRSVDALFCNHVTVTAFARYSVDVVRQYRDALQSGSLTAKVYDLLRHFESLDSAVGGIAAATAGTHKDEIRIIWDLAPLSFVAEWFSTIGDVIDRLNTFAEERVAPLPTSLDGTWGTERCELLAGMPGLEVTSFDADAQVTRWDVAVYRVSYNKELDESHNIRRADEWLGMATASAATVTYKLTYQENAVTRLTRTGLYRAIRGMVAPTFGEITTPQVHVRLDGGKISSLVALLVSFLGGRRSRG